MNAKTSRIEDYVYISVICDATGMCARSSLSFKIFAQVRQFFSDFKHILWVCVNLFGQNQCTNIFCFGAHSGTPDPIYIGTSLYEHIL